MRSMTKRIGVLGVCAVALVWLPLMAYAGVAVSTPQSPFTSASIFYRNELLVAACIVASIMGAYISASWNPPDELAALMKRNTPKINALCSVAGSGAAFLYVLHHYNSLTILHPVWVLGCSFATPLALQVAAPYAVQQGVKWLERGGVRHDK